jgi:hypothetical protein
MRSLTWAFLFAGVYFAQASLGAEDGPAKSTPPPAPGGNPAARATPAAAVPASPEKSAGPEKSAAAAKPAAGPQKPTLPMVEEPIKRVSDPEAVAIVENYLKAIGGRDVLSKIKDRTTLFMNTKNQATGETKVEINLLMKEGIMIREEWDVKGFDIKGEKLAFVQIYNGKEEEGWVQMLGTVSPLDGRTLQVFVWDKYMDDFFAHWQDDGFTVNLVGQGLVSKEIMGEEQPCDVIQVADFSGRQAQKYFFSKKDGLLVKKEWQDDGPNPKAKVKKEQYYKLYRDLPFMDGSKLSIKFPLRIEIYVDGDLDTERAYTNVKFNSGLSDKLFDKPEGKPFEGAVGGPKGPPPATTPEAPAGSAPRHGQKGPAPKLIQATPPAGAQSGISPAPPATGGPPATEKTEKTEKK